MTQSNEPNDYQRDLNRRFRDLSWRVERLETSQMPARSLNESFDRVYDEIDALEDQINARFDRLESENREMRAELNGKIDIIMRHITGQANS
jgi:predicted nuclease with TOPRIM domain